MTDEALRGFTRTFSSIAAVGDGGGERMSALHAVAALLAALTTADADGRVIVDGAAGTLRFVLLNAAAHFAKASLKWPRTSDHPATASDLVPLQRAPVGLCLSCKHVANSSAAEDSKWTCPTPAHEPTTTLRCGMTVLYRGHISAQQVVSEAHAVILASGTLAPVSAVTRQLFPGPDAAARLRHFSCGHVVNKERLLTVALGASGSGLW